MFSVYAVYQKDAETDIAGDTSGDFKRLLIGCLQGNRPEGPEFDRNKAKLDAQGALLRTATSTDRFLKFGSVCSN